MMRFAVSVALTTAMAVVAGLLPLTGLHAQEMRPAPGTKMARSMTVDDNTIMLLKVDGQKGALTDATGRFTPTVNGGTVADDETFGKCLQFGEAGTTGITVNDGGKITFTNGFTLEAWVYLQEDGKPNPGGTFAGKFGSFWFDIKDYRLNNSWMVFPNEPIFTTNTQQFKYYPVDSETFGGSTAIPPGQWVYLAVTYDQRLKVIRTWIDGAVDRTRYLTRQGDGTLQSNGSPINFLQGMKHCKVGAIRLSSGARPIGPVPCLETYVEQLPYEGKTAVIFDHIDKSLRLPLEVRFMWENPNAAAIPLPSVTLNSYDKQTVILKNQGWSNAPYTLHIRAYQDHEVVYTRSAVVANAMPAGNITINSDKSISVAGKKIFPLMMYNVFPEDYAEVAALGFNIIYPRKVDLGFMDFNANDEKGWDNIKKCLDEAQKNNVYLALGSNLPHKGYPQFKDHPSLLFWYLADEPWGTFDRLTQGYNVGKMLDPGRPIFCTQNNTTRYADTSEASDIIACDPYPIPNVSLRGISETTGTLVKAVDGLKPVWTVLDQYGGRQPNLQEMRCMMYLALIAGANGIGIYAWDDRLDRKTGWYIKEHPEDMEVLKQSIGELKSLEAILLIPNSARKLTWTPANSALHAAVKEAGNRTYLFVANDSREPLTGMLELDGMGNAAGRCLADGGDKAGIRLQAGKVVLKLPALGAAVYELTPAP